MDEETLLYIRAVEKRLDDLRAADKEAIRLAHADLSHRLEGFPQQFATKDELDAMRGVVGRLEKDGVSREIYETNHSALQDLVRRLEIEKMPEATFTTFVDNYRIQQEEAAIERRAVASALASATAASRAEGERRTGVTEGATASWKQIGVIGGLVIAVMSIVVVVANQFLGNG
jgi:hypothetical protein